MARQKVDPTRENALKTLRRTETALSFPKLLIDHSPEKASLKDLDRAFTYQLVMGTLRYRGTIDWALDKLCDASLDSFTSWIRNILRMGLFQILYLDRTPKSAAVDESVKLAKKYGHSGTAGLVNAVLRNAKKDEILRSVEELAETDAHDLAVKYSHPQWLVELMIDDWDLETAVEVLKRNNDIPPLTARVNTLRITREALIETLKGEGVTAEPLAHVEDGVEIESPKGLSKLKAYRDGLLYFQDTGTMLVTRCLDPKPNEQILDTCAGPGGKATHIAELMENKGRIHALDIHDHKIGLIDQNAKRLGVGIIVSRKEDATGKLSDRYGDMDRVIVDAPCSGIGVIRRRLDLKWRLRPDQIEPLARLQFSILEKAAECVKSGGILLYCTCSISQRENADVVKGFLKDHSEFAVDLDLPGDVKRYMNEDGFVQIMPGDRDMDGFFIARLKRL